jgi:hypothetical protein
MAKNSGKNQPAAAPKGDMKVVKRSTRNSFERKCLPKEFKVLFAGSDRATFKMLLKAWQEGRKRPAANV